MITTKHPFSVRALLHPLEDQETDHDTVHLLIRHDQVSYYLQLPLSLLDSTLLTVQTVRTKHPICQLTILTPPPHKFVMYIE